VEEFTSPGEVWKLLWEATSPVVISQWEVDKWPNWMIYLYGAGTSGKRKPRPNENVLWSHTWCPVSESHASPTRWPVLGVLAVQMFVGRWSGSSLETARATAVKALNNNNHNNTKLYRTFLNTQRHITWRQEPVTNGTKQRNGKTKQTEQTNRTYW